MKRLQSLVVIAMFACTVITIQPLFGAGDHIKPYGNLYVFFGYAQSDTYDLGGKKEIDRDTIYAINEDSNLGMNFSYEKYKGVFELGLSDYEDGRKVKVRKVYGIYSSDLGKIMIGQAYNPYVKYSNEAANYYRSKGFGALYEDPTTQFRIISSYGIYIGIIKPYTASDTFHYNQEVDNPESSSDSTNNEYKLEEIEREITTKLPLDNIQSMVPKTVIGYELKNNFLKGNIGIACNVYKINKSGEIEFNKQWIISYLAYLHSTVTIKNLFINLSGGFAVNPANFGIDVQSKDSLKYHGGAAASVYNLATGKFEIKDTWNIQAYMEFGYNISKSLNIIIGGGYSIVDYPMENTEQDKAFEIYLNTKINLGGLIAITPSVSYHDYMEDMEGNKEGADIYAGILATISFY